MRRLLLADLGEIDLAAVIPALSERYAAAVVTLALDVGQPDHAASRRAQALAAGAIRAHVVDARDVFARDGLLRLLQAGALRADDVSLPAAFLRIVTAAKLIEVAEMEGTTLLAHGAQPGSAASDHLTRLIARHSPECFLVAAGAETPGSDARVPGRSRRVEGTLWWRQHVSSGTTAPTPAAGPDSTALLEVAFTSGVPVALNGVEMPLVELIEAADTIAGDHGVGRFIHPIAGESGSLLTILETPAAAVLVAAHAALTQAAVSPALRRLRRQAAARYVTLLRSGEWLSDAREALDAFFAEAQKRVTGTARLRLSRGRCRVVGRTVTSAEMLPEHAPTAQSAGLAVPHGTRADLVVSH